MKKHKFFSFCPESQCNAFERELITKADIRKICPVCHSKLKHLKMPIDQFEKEKDTIALFGIANWYTVNMFEKQIFR